MKETNDAALSDVRQAIERGTAKVSLRDLEKKGYRQVKVLKAGDIDKLVHQAVLSVLAKRGHKLVDESEREKFEAEAKAEYQKLLKARKDAEGSNQELAGKIQDLEEQCATATKERDELKEKVGKQRDKLLELETRRQESEARAVSLDKQVKEGSASQQKLVQTYERQVSDLRREKDEAVRAAASSGEVADLQGQMARAKAQNAAMTERVKGLESEKQDLIATRADLVADKRMLEKECERLRAELAEEKLSAKAGNSRVEQMLAGLAQMIQNRPAQADTSALSGELSKMFDQFSSEMSGKLSRRMVNEAGDIIDAEGAAAAAITGMMLDEASGKKLETNVEQVDVKASTTKGDVKSKLAKLRSLKGGK